MKQSVLRLLAFISLVVAVSVASFAQSSAARSLSGVVKDPNGAVVKDVEVLAATPASVDVALQVGAAGETIQVTGAGEVLQTQSANVSNTIIGRQITDLPFASRNALDLVLFLPGVSSPARPRQS